MFFGALYSTFKTTLFAPVCFRALNVDRGPTFYIFMLWFILFSIPLTVTLFLFYPSLVVISTLLVIRMWSVPSQGFLLNFVCDMLSSRGFYHLISSGEIHLNKWYPLVFFSDLHSSKEFYHFGFVSDLHFSKKFYHLDLFFLVIYIHLRNFIAWLC